MFDIAKPHAGNLRTGVLTPRAGRKPKTKFDTAKPHLGSGQDWRILGRVRDLWPDGTHLELLIPSRTRFWPFFAAASSSPDEAIGGPDRTETGVPPTRGQAGDAVEKSGLPEPSRRTCLRPST
jgi:hypothetical protein